MSFIQSLINMIKNLDTHIFWIFVVLLVGGSIVSWMQWFKKTKRARLIEDVPTSTIRSAAQGYTELIGNAEFLPDGKIVSPLSGRSCVWYSYKVERRERDSDGRRDNWKTIEKVTSEHLFMLEDDTGKCIVDPDFAEVKTYEKQTWYGSVRNPGHAPTKRGMLDGINAEYRYTERWIEPAEMLYAIGNFETEGTGEELASVRDDVRAVLNKWKQHPDIYLKRFDKNNDGQIDEQEWAEARRAAKQEVEQERMKMAGLPAVHVMRKPPEKSNIYILSSFSDEELVKIYRNRSRWLLISSIVLGAIAVWMLNIRF